MEHAEDDGLILGDSVRPIFYRRLALGVPRKNPKLLYCLDDLCKANIRLAVMKPDKGRLGKITGHLISRSGMDKALQKNITLTTDRHDDLAKALATDRCDAVICWDTLENLAPDHIVIIRLAGQEAEEIVAGIMKASSRNPEAGNLVGFLASGESAKQNYRKHGYSLAKERPLKIRKSQFYKNFYTHNFYYIYQLLPRQIVDDYGITKGTYLDIGCGGAQMLINMARITDLECVGLDIEPEILEVAKKNVAEAGFSKRFKSVAGDVHNLPLPDDFADLITSRGSIPFWRDRVKAFKEIYRVLKPGGVAYIGGGGSRYLTKDYYQQIRAPWVSPERRKKFNIPRIGKIDEILAHTKIPNYRTTKEAGTWVEIRK
ncbi:MAG: methyltransferase domain-containing protein [Thermodesulfobacteriota bacterium]|nr:methyltransferase domain-containing protein [Thermodesulfobacteriota bacterium]